MKRLRIPEVETLIGMALQIIWIETVTMMESLTIMIETHMGGNAFRP